MQFGLMSVSDLTTDPTTGRTPTEAERIANVLTMATHAEEAGLGVDGVPGGTVLLLEVPDGGDVVLVGGHVMSFVVGLGRDQSVSTR